MLPSIEYDRDADAIYIHLRNLPYAYGEDLDHERRIDYANDGQPIGVELLGASTGVTLDNLPQREQMVSLLRAHNIKIFANDWAKKT